MNGLFGYWFDQTAIKIILIIEEMYMWSDIRWYWGIIVNFGRWDDNIIVR